VSEPHLPDQAHWDAHVHVFDANWPVHPGHYQPRTHSLADIEAIAQAQGVGRLVLVQPSVYGTDNRLMLQALASEPGRHRGVAVVDGAISDSELNAMHALGVRGIRFNLVSPVGGGEDPGEVLRRLGPRLSARAWHVQWYAQPAHLSRIAVLQAQTGLTFVLDHLAGLHVGLSDTDPAWGGLGRLAAGGAWIKLSGWYRLNDSAPFAALKPHLTKVAHLFGPRMVWGSDWPHTSLPASHGLAYADTLAPLKGVLSEDALQAALGRQPQLLYGG
jgi:predicted TIM-barrel fold metal-dependent hydrolase